MPNSLFLNPVFQPLDSNGNPLSTGSVRVTLANSETLADLYTDIGGTPASNPLDFSNGKVSFYADAGLTYDVYIYAGPSGTGTLEDTIEDYQPGGGGSGGSGDVTGSGTAYKLAMWDDTKNLTDSTLTDDGSGNVSVTPGNTFTANTALVTNNLYLGGNLATKILEAADGLSISDAELCSAGYVASKYLSEVSADGTTILGDGSVGDPLRTHWQRSGTTITQAISGDDIAVVDGVISISEDGESLDIDPVTGVSSSAGIPWDIAGDVTVGTLTIDGDQAIEILIAGDSEDAADDRQLTSAGWIQSAFLKASDIYTTFLQLNAANGPLTGTLGARDINPSTTGAYGLGTSLLKWLTGYITTLFADIVQATTSAGLLIKNMSGTTAVTIGAGGGTGVTTADGVNVGGALGVTGLTTASGGLTTPNSIRLSTPSSQAFYYENGSSVNRFAHNFNTGDDSLSFFTYTDAGSFRDTALKIPRSASGTIVIGGTRGISVPGSYYYGSNPSSPANGDWYTARVGTDLVTYNRQSGVWVEIQRLTGA